MTKPRMTLTARSFAYASLFAACPYAVSVHAAKARTEWISIYNGNEANFSKADRSRLLSALKGLGVEHVIRAENQEILVNAYNRSLIQDLLAKVMAQQSVRP